MKNPEQQIAFFRTYHSISKGSLRICSLVNAKSIRKKNLELPYRYCRANIITIFTGLTSKELDVAAFVVLTISKPLLDVTL